MQTIILGLDAFDPKLYERLHSEGKLPNLGKYVENEGYARLGVSTPPQSEVSWTSIATGEDPGGHGIFDFVHRNPKNYALEVSLLPTKKTAVGTQFTPPHRAKTLFDAAVEMGYMATSLWWPATFPAKLDSPVRTIPGLGAPDILGRLGVGCLFTLSQESGNNKTKTALRKLESLPDDKYQGKLEGPQAKTLRGTSSAQTPFELSIKDEQVAELRIGKQSIELSTGAWSPIMEITFKVGFGLTIKAVTRAVLVQISPEPHIYFLPLQIHPLHSAWNYGTPKGFVKDLWKNCGPFLTLGWPQDTSGLEDGIIDDEQFLDLCGMIFEERERVFMYLLGQYKEGVLACVFDTLDRVQHMFWRSQPEIVEAWYRKLDGFIGRVEKRLAGNSQAKDVQLMVISDHGFDKFGYKVHLNRWLVEQGYLKTSKNDAEGSLKDVDWSQSRAYAIGLNSIYLNQSGREGQGVVDPVERADTLKRLEEVLLQWKGPDGQPVVKSVGIQEEIYQGPLVEYGPDIIVGYSPGYRASAETGLGEWENDAIEKNEDHWGADHCFDADSVPGVLFSSKGLGNLNAPTYRDIPALALGQAFQSGATPAPPSHNEEDEDVVMERLKDLGYL
jgi:predicted AlkP superfamily phosphohydrolase/phosphomutase